MTTRPIPARAMQLGIALPLLLALLAAVPRSAESQSRVGKDSSTRIARYGHDLAYGGAMAFAYAGVDQARNDPIEWGKGWPGYGKRLASNLGEFVIQETVTDLLAAAMNRPLDYQPSPHRKFGARVGWALQRAFTDPMPDHTHPIAVPRIVGAYAGSFAQASWRPGTETSRTRIALVNGTTSLLIGGVINLYHEMRR
jgi:hypothetical protein